MRDGVIEQVGERAMQDVIWRDWMQQLRMADCTCYMRSLCTYAALKTESTSEVQLRRLARISLYLRDFSAEYARLYSFGAEACGHIAMGMPLSCGF